MGNTDLKLQETSAGRAESLRAALPSYEKAIQLSRQAQALAEPSRIILLALLVEAGELCVSDLCLITEREQSGVSRNLRILWENDLLDKHKYNHRVYYRASETGTRLLAALLDE